jgi:molybdopterin synthase sulfur carrier subunit
MSIYVRYFASLREQMGRDSDKINADEVSNVGEVWHQVSGGMEMPENTLCAVNKEYVKPDAPVKAGDEVAFFPPVTGG